MERFGLCNISFNTHFSYFQFFCGKMTSWWRHEFRESMRNDLSTVLNVSSIVYNSLVQLWRDLRHAEYHLALISAILGYFCMTMTSWWRHKLWESMRNDSSTVLNASSIVYNSLVQLWRDLCHAEWYFAVISAIFGTFCMKMTSRWRHELWKSMKNDFSTL